MKKRYKRIVNLKPLNPLRLKSIYLLSLLIIIALFGRVINLQVFNSHSLKTKARKQSKE